MKKRHFRLLCCALIAALLVQTSPMTFAADGESGLPAEEQPQTGQLSAAEAVDTAEIPAEAAVEENEILPMAAEIAIPDTWAHDALAFAVENDIMVGNDAGDLQPANPSTRAQMATMMTRLIGAADADGNLSVKGGDLSSFRDLSADGWYAPYLSVAVRYQIFTGISAVQFSPNASITREQAFTVIGRMLGMGGGSADQLRDFSDASSVSAYAAGYLADLVKAGYVNGNNKNQLRPKATISRQELAQVLYNIFGQCDGAICRTGDTPAASGSVLYCSSDPIADGTVIEGDLILSADCETLDLSNVTIGGKLVIFGRDDAAITLTGCDVKQVVLIGQASVTADRPVEKLNACGANLGSYTGDAQTLLCSSNVTVCGNYSSVTVSAGSLTAAPDSHIGDAQLNGYGAMLQLQGESTVESIVLNGKESVVYGTGAVTNALLHGRGSTVNCKCANKQEQIDYVLSGTKVSFTSQPSASPSAPTMTATVKVTGVNGGYGSDNGKRIGTLRWYVNGKLMKTIDNFVIQEGATSSYSITYTFSRYMDTNTQLQCTITHQDEQISAATKVAVNNYSDSYYAVRAIRTSNGVIARGDYTTFEKETFVNAKGYSSKTGWLVWTNLYHTKVNVFTGYTGHWKLVKAFDCGIGARDTQTPVGIYRIQTQEKYSRWYYGDRYVDTISRWQGGYAFHSRMKWVKGGGYVANDLNVMISHGCIRMNTQEAAYIRDTVKLGSTVVVY